MRAAQASFPFPRFASVFALASRLGAQSGEEIYRSGCAHYHDGAVLALTASRD